MHALRLMDEPRDMMPDSAPIELRFAGASDDAAAPEETITYERGSLVYARDGQVGKLKQVVVDEEMAEVKALVVQTPARKEPVLVPPELVEKSAAGTLLLNVTREQFAAGASRAPRFDPHAFAGADLNLVDKVIPLVFRGDPRRSVARISRDRVATGTAPLGDVAHRRSWRRLLGQG